ncbi:OmpA family protein [Candidatus Vondammii sp. HM_W22]|uniref:OmpA family protein n=1 Tax=Candidatus Vondammii sp. HM_W22 TaxID=2687299 RepID=UPI001F130C99|nr:OmpA family protein [Candidatus Vondammii sp. HM_W22]
MQKLALVVLLTSMTIGCTTIVPYTRDEKTSNTVKGVGIGAVVGGIAGALANKGDRGKGAVIGAALGAGAGGGIGYYMDQQEANLRRTLEGSGVSVTRNGDRITLNMSGNITFDTGSTSIKSSFYEVLDSVGLVLKEFNESDTRVAGHTDSSGGEKFNQRLSEHRAESVASYLGRRPRVDPRRIYAMGYGETMPVASNATSSGRSRNRRVEIEIMPPRRIRSQGGV